MKNVLALLVLAVLSFWPFLDFPEWRGTEARRVQIATEMVATGDYIVPRLWREETFAKPPFYYWVLAGSFHVFGVSSLSARLPSLLAFWVLAVATFLFVRRWFDQGTANVAAAAVLLSPLVMHDAPFAEIDPFFAVLTVLSLLFLADGVYLGRWRLLAVAGVLGGIAVMTKGPPYLMFALGPLLMWWRHRRLRGLLLYLVPVLAFYLAYKLVLDARGPSEEAGRVALEESLGRLLAFGTWDSLSGIPSHLLRCAVLIGLPFSFWWWRWWRETRRARDPGSWRQNFLLWGAIGAFAVVVFSKDRASRYLLPAAPMILIGLAPIVAREIQRDTAPPAAVRKGLAVVGMVAGIAAAAIAWIPHPSPGTSWITILALGGVAVVVHDRGQLARYAMLMPLVIAWSAFPDREAYVRTADDFVPSRAAVLARELRERGITEVATYGHVGTAILLHTRAALGDRLEILADSVRRQPPTLRWVITVDRGARGVESVAGYREVLRLQLSKSKSLALRERM